MNFSNLIRYKKNLFYLALLGNHKKLKNIKIMLINLLIQIFFHGTV